jgi:hypothetical protein
MQEKNQIHAFNFLDPTSWKRNNNSTDINEAKFLNVVNAFDIW